MGKHWHPLEDKRSHLYNAASGQIAPEHVNVADPLLIGERMAECYVQCKSSRWDICPHQLFAILVSTSLSMSTSSVGLPSPETSYSLPDIDAGMDVDAACSRPSYLCIYCILLIDMYLLSSFIMFVVCMTSSNIILTSI